MITRIGDVDDVQGKMIRTLTNQRGTVTPRIYRDAHAEFLRRSGGRIRAHACAQPVLMYVNHGNWVGDCPECKAGVSAGRGWTTAACFGCGAVFSRVVWPAHVAAIEAVLLKRLPPNRNCAHDESPAHLMADNVRHGVASATGPGLALLPDGPLRQALTAGVAPAYPLLEGDR